MGFGGKQPRLLYSNSNQQNEATDKRNRKSIQQSSQRELVINTNSEEDVKEEPPKKKSRKRKGDEQEGNLSKRSRTGSSGKSSSRKRGSRKSRGLVPHEEDKQESISTSAEVFTNSQLAKVKQDDEELPSSDDAQLTLEILEECRCGGVAAKDITVKIRSTNIHLLSERLCQRNIMEDVVHKVMSLILHNPFTPLGYTGVVTFEYTKKELEQMGDKIQDLEWQAFGGQHGAV